MTGGLARGLALYLGVVLATAGTLKLADLDQTRTSLSRLVNVQQVKRLRLHTMPAVLLGVGEVGLGLTLVFAPLLTPVALAVVIVCAGFVGVVRLAQRRGVACGCFSSFSVHVAGPVELARALALLAASLLMVVFDLFVAGDGRAAWLGVVVGVLAGAIGTLAAMKLASPKASIGDVVLARKPQPHRPWRRIRMTKRRALLRSLRTDPIVHDVERRAPVELHWRHARASASMSSTRVVSVVVPGDGVRLQMIVPVGGGTPAVVAYTPTGVILPSLDQRPA